MPTFRNQMWVKYKLKYKLCWVGRPARRYGLQKGSRNIGPKDSTIWALVLYWKILFGEQINCSKGFLFNKLIYKSLSHVSTPCIHPSFLISAYLTTTASPENVKNVRMAEKCQRKSTCLWRLLSTRWKREGHDGEHFTEFSSPLGLRGVFTRRIFPI